MAEDTLAAIGIISGTLLEKLTANHELCSAVMALTGFLAIEMQGCRAKRVLISDVEMTGRQMRARATFDFLGASSAPMDVPGSDKIVNHLGQEGQLFHDFIRQHPDVVKWIRQVVEKMETYAITKGVKFADLGFGDHGAFVDPGRYIILEIAE